MKYLPIALILFLFSCTNQADNSSSSEVSDSIDITGVETENDSERALGNLFEDLKDYEGFYSNIEYENGFINVNNLSSEIAEKDGLLSDSAEIRYLKEKGNGYLFVFDVKYSSHDKLIISTLDNDYNVVDFKKYQVINTDPIRESDTIASLWYSEADVTIEFMHPNFEEEPSFEINGIYKEVIEISDDLEIIVK